jgi:glycosyltransferase involved in cell wall biosynthesis
MNVVRAQKFFSERAEGNQPKPKPLVSVIVPAFNEAAIIARNLTKLCEYLQSLERDYRWELIVVNDGSTDATGELADGFARARENVRVLHHKVNLNLGQALRTAFRHCRGDYVVTMDVDLSYSPMHIERMLKKLRESEAALVLASPYMEGGQCSNVPRDREILSRCANRYLSFMAGGNLATLTGMVRAYDGRFLRALNLKSTGMEINTEIIYKAQLLHARIAEIPAHLNWELQKSGGVRRASHIKILRHLGQCLFSGFIFKPAAFFVLPALVSLVIAGCTFGRMLFHTITQYQNLAASAGIWEAPIFAALTAAFHHAPYTFWIGGLSTLFAAQLLGLGLLAVQNKRYFEELIHTDNAVRFH